LATLLKLGTSGEEPWVQLSVHIGLFNFDADQLARDVPTFTALVENVVGKLFKPDIGPSTFENNQIRVALNCIENITPILTSLPEYYPLTRDLVFYVTSITLVYKEEEVIRKLGRFGELDEFGKKFKEFEQELERKLDKPIIDISLRSYLVWIFVAGLAIVFFVGKFVIGPIWYAQDSSSDAPVHKRSSKETKKDGSKKGTGKNKGSLARQVE